MMDMFTIILVFLLKSYSTQGQIVTPAKSLELPTSTVQQPAAQALQLMISQKSITVEDKIVVDSQQYQKVKTQTDYLITPLHNVLKKYAEEARKFSAQTKDDFSGKITVQGDVHIPYRVLTRVMYTCGQAGYPKINLLVYRKN